MLDAAARSLALAIEEMLPEDLGRIAKRAKELSLTFTSERGSLGPDYLSNPDSLLAYLAAFALPNAMKVMHCLDQAGPYGGEISVLDIGAGPGAASIAASLFFSASAPRSRVRIAAVDRSRPALEIAHRLFRRIAPPEHSLESATLDLASLPLREALVGERFDAVVAANVLNELDEDFSFRMCGELAEGFLKEDGSLIIVEPALRETARPLMRLRDRLVEKGHACVSAPCLHQGPCPMLSSGGRDWCHFYIDWELPAFLRELDRLSGMDHTHLKMSCVIFQPKASAGSFALAQDDTKGLWGPESRATNHGLWRVVSSPLVSKGKRELMLCGESGELLRMMRQNKDASEANGDFERAMRGDIVSAPASRRLGREAPFSIEKSWR